MASSSASVASRFGSRLLSRAMAITGIAARLADTASSRWYIIVEILPYIVGSLFARALFADVLGLCVFVAAGVPSAAAASSLRHSACLPACLLPLLQDHF